MTLLTEAFGWQQDYMAELKASCPEQLDHIEQNAVSILREESQRRAIRADVEKDQAKRDKRQKNIDKARKKEAEQTLLAPEGVSEHALFRQMLKQKSRYTKALHRLNDWREKNFDDSEHDYVRNDECLINCWITECRLSWGSDQLKDGLLDLLDSLKVEEGADNFEPQWDWETVDK